MWKVKISFLLMFAGIMVSAQSKIDLTLESNYYFAVQSQQPPFASTPEIEHYMVPVTLGAIVHLPANLYLKAGIGYRIEKHTPLTNPSQEVKRSLSAWEYSLGPGFAMSFGKFSPFLEASGVYSESFMGKTSYEDLNSNVINTSSRYNEGKYFDLQFSSGASYKINNRLHIGLKINGRTPVWRRSYSTKDYKFIYRFNSYYKNVLLGGGISVQYSL